MCYWSLYYLHRVTGSFNHLCILNVFLTLSWTENDMLFDQAILPKAIENSLLSERVLSHQSRSVLLNSSLCSVYEDHLYLDRLCVVYEQDPWQVIS